MIKKNKGCLCENLAVVWLQEQGFDVKMLGKRKDGSIIARSPRIKDKRIHILSVDLLNKKCRIVPKRKAIWN